MKTSKTHSLIKFASWQKQGQTENDETDPDETSAEGHESYSDDQSNDDQINDDTILDESIRRNITDTDGHCKVPSFNAIDNLKMLIYFVNTDNDSCLLQKELQKIETDDGQLNARQIRYRVKKLHDKLNNPNKNEVRNLLRYWLNVLLDDPHIELLFSDSSVVIDPKYLPRNIIVSRKAEVIAKKLVTSRKNVSDNTKRVGIDYVVTVAKECSLSTGKYKDIGLLSKATSCHRSFAKKVLVSIESGEEDTLYKRSITHNAIKATNWPEEICKFVLHEINSRSVPGEEQVSVRYGYRLPKYILLHSRNDIAAAFKKENPQCPFTVSTIKREFPQNAVTSTTQDL